MTDKHNPSPSISSPILTPPHETEAPRIPEHNKMTDLTPPPKALIVGISGPSSSGKTTLARLLQRVFCGVSLQAETLNTFIIHEDDFYYPDDQ
jgi:pantothenate kinase-related protein Tda10